MPSIIMNGPAGRLEGRYKQSANPHAPIAIVLHPHPLHGGTMNNKVVYTMYNTLIAQGFSVMRFNFRGVGQSQGTYEDGEGELADAIAALEFMQDINKDHGPIWVAGFSFGAWVSMQLLMRRPEIEGFISVAPPANMYDFSFLAPCPTSGLVVQGNADTVVTEPSVKDFVKVINKQKRIDVTYNVIQDANHFFHDKHDELSDTISTYLDQRLNVLMAAE